MPFVINPIQDELFRFCIFSGCKKQLQKKAKFCSLSCYWKFKKGRTRDLRRKHNHHIMIRVNGERVYEHRHVFETKVRALKEGEIVHHKNEDKHCNDPENLEALEGRAAHLHTHNYWRDRRFTPEQEAQVIADFQEYGF